MSTSIIAVDAVTELLVKTDALYPIIVELKSELGATGVEWVNLSESLNSGATSIYGFSLSLLTDWVRRSGECATVEELCNILVRVGGTYLSDILQAKVNRMNFGQCVAIVETNPQLIVTETVDNSPNSTMSEINNYRAGRLEEFSKLSTRPKFKKGVVPYDVLEQLKSLPIFSMKSQLIEAVQKNQIVIVVGEAGSGKSTQIPTYLAEAGFAEHGIIGCTQPRRMAAKSLAERVSIECGVELGSSVGYAVRFDKCVSSQTVIKFMTDGLLIREFAIHPDLSDYSIMIIDEAHERSKYTDVCFGLLKSLVKKNPNLKVIITSATLEEHKFSTYFDAAPIINVSGTMYPVIEIHDPIPRGIGDYLDGAVDTVCRIHLTETHGDILVFLPGQGDIEKAEEALRIRLGSRFSQVEVVPCYGMLSLERQNQIFKPTKEGCRKVALATNVAETSLTIPGIVYVVDAGFFKQSEYDPKFGVECLQLKRITQTQATQRKGRAGRTKPGKVYRLYSPAVLESLNVTGIPEIQRCNLESVVLQLVAMGVEDVFKFDFMDTPKKDGVCEHLQDLSALDKDMKLTPLGRLMAEFPLDPSLAKVLITSTELRCSKETLIIVAFLSIPNQDIFVSDKTNREQVNTVKKQFNHPEGDQLTCLRIFNAWEQMNYSRQWCREMFLSIECLEEVKNIVGQLLESMHLLNLPVVSCGSGSLQIRKSLCAGYFRKLAKRYGYGFSYDMVTGSKHKFGDKLFLHPTSSLFPQKPAPAWILYTEVFKTAKAYMRGSIVIDLDWVEQLAPMYYKKIRAHHPSIF